MNPTSNPPDIASIVVETALDTYRDAFREALIRELGAECIERNLEDGIVQLDRVLAAARPSVHAVMERARPRIPPSPPHQNRRERRAAEAAARRGRS